MTVDRQLPGRLGDPKSDLGTDPRADPRMVAALAAIGLDRHPDPLPVSADASREQLLEICAMAEQGFEAVFDQLLGGLAPVPGVTTETVSIDGPDGNQITLYIHRPAQADRPLPGVVHLHGGGMTILRAANACYRRWRDELAASGLVVVGVEFRNGGGALGNHPYPAGLSDCVTATRWVLEHAERLGIGKVLVSGESGGGNLSLAVALRANREGWADQIAGVYAQCPYISNQYTEPPAELASMAENDGYFISLDVLALMSAVYDPSGANAADATCWPLRASDAELAGLPPHVISVNELDPLRDEGLAYLRRLLANGVSALGRTVHATCHGGDVLLRSALPDVYAATVRDISGFAHSR
ncbi:MAG TPA: alpha/beta hydrolase fold domain-containing protein [Pseudonocardia sp.]|jgi:acetyl esterase/lipase